MTTTAGDNNLIAKNPENGVGVNGIGADISYEVNSSPNAEWPYQDDLDGSVLSILQGNFGDADWFEGNNVIRFFGGSNDVWTPGMRSMKEYQYVT